MFLLLFTFDFGFDIHRGFDQLIVIDLIGEVVVNAFEFVKDTVFGVGVADER
jgi:hypothetical protein